MAWPRPARRCSTNDFDIENGFHWVEKASLKGILRKTESRGRDAVCFVNLGHPMPGVKIRIVNEKSQVVPEGKIGSLHIFGNVVTPGYRDNPEANKEALLPDGWLNTGDLGFILNGELSITGRQKEIIIIRGLNFYCYEIEDVVNTVDGVEPTFAGATAIDDPATGTEGLAVFFTPQPGADPIEVNRAIRSRVTSSFGISPSYVIPIERAIFPKTTSGKIQRLDMRKALESGTYDRQIKEIDLALENARTIPDWFFRVEWQPKRPRGRARVSTGRRLIVTGDTDLATALGGDAIVVAPGLAFERRDAHRFVINIERPADYQSLAEALKADDVRIAGIVHAVGYGPQPAGGVTADAAMRDQWRGSLGVAALTRLFATGLSELVVLTSDAPSIGTAPFTPAAGSLRGLLKTIAQEQPELLCRHIDIDAADPIVAAAHVVAEVACDSVDIEVAYRQGQRLVPVLRKVDWTSDARRPMQIERGGIYLITGGLGAIGRELARLLLANYDARLVLVGRTDLADDSARAEALEDLKRLGHGAAIYRVADVADAAAIKRAIGAAEAAWNGRLAGVFHLAGIPGIPHDDRLDTHQVASESLESYDAMYRAKVNGTVVIAGVLDEYADPLFVNFSSVNGFFGGTGVGPYAAASSFVDAFSTFQNRVRGRRTHSIAWSLWDAIGMSRGHGMRDAVLARGFHAIALAQGVTALMAAMELGADHLIAGLNAAHWRIREQMPPQSLPAQAVAIHYESLEADVPAIEAAMVDRVRIDAGETVPVHLRRHAQLPLLTDGTVDRLALRRLRPEAATDAARPLSPGEAKLVEIWSDVLGVSHPSVSPTSSSLAAIRSRPSRSCRGCRARGCSAR